MVMASIGFYPGYAGTTVAGGTFVVTQKDATTLTVSYSLTGLTAANGGLHIHSGTSCQDTGSVGGHFFKTAPDPWTTEWKKDANGAVIGTFDVACGYTVDEVLSHTVVVHQGTDKVGCGVLQSSNTPINAASITTYPGYVESDVKARGMVAVSSATLAGGAADAGLKLQYRLSGLKASNTSGLHIHAGTSCSSADGPGAHYWNSQNGAPDPWNTTYTSDAQGNAGGAFTLDAGYPFSKMVGHAIVVHSGGSKVGCGVLAAEATMAKYPGYTGALAVSGSVRVFPKDATTQTVSFVLAGLEASKIGQVHVHTGTSCAAAGDVGGHYWKGAGGATDPWTKENCPVSSNTAGVAIGSFDLAYGYDTMGSLARTVVVHDSSGARVACGVLSGELAATPTAAPIAAPTAAAPTAPTAPTAAAPTAPTADSSSACEGKKDIKLSCSNKESYCEDQYESYGKQFCAKTCCEYKAGKTISSAVGNVVNMPLIVLLGTLYLL
jgi:Cu/Zn superoxide dismutase